MQFPRKVGKYLPAISRDVAGIAGAVLISYGAWLWFAPLGFIVGGILLLTGVVLLSMKAD